MTRRTRLQAWSEDGPLRNVLKFGSVVMAGKLGSAFFGLITMMILARSLGVKAFGTLAVVRTYVFVLDSLVNFQSWQGLIKFGSDAVEQNDTSRFKSLLKFTAMLDVGTAIAGALVGVAGAPLVAGLFEWDAATTRLAQVYAAGIAFRVTGIYDGVFRLFDLYRVPAILNTLTTGAIALALGIASFSNLTLGRAVLILVVLESLSFVVLNAVAVVTLSKRGFGGWMRASAARAVQSIEGLWSFFLSTNVIGSLKKMRADLDIAVVGAMLGDAPAGLLRVAKQIGAIPGKLVNPFEQVVYTELAKQVSAGPAGKPKRLLLRVVVVMLVLGPLVWLAGSLLARQLITWTAGEAYLDAVPVLVAVLAATALSFVLMPLTRGLVAFGLPQRLLKASVINTLIYFPLLLWMTHRFGVVGAALSLVLHRLVFVGWLGVLNAQAEPTRR